MEATAQELVDKITSMIFQPLALLLFSIGFLIFIYGLVEFISDPTNTERQRTGKQHMMYGTLGLLIMVSIWGIVHLVTDTLGLQRDASGLFK